MVRKDEKIKGLLGVRRWHVPRLPIGRIEEVGDSLSDRNSWRCFRFIFAVGTASAWQ